MLILILAYLGGILTIASPCILPVLPFIFSRADRPFLRSGLPLLVGMALTFGASSSNNTPAGTYSADLSLIASGKF